MSSVIAVSVVMFVLAVVVGTVAVMSLLGTLPRNRYAGVRTADSMRDDATFAMANRVAGPATAAAALILVVGGIAALVFAGALSIIAVLVTVVAAVLTAAAGGSIGARAAAASAPEEVGGCGHSCISCSLKDACQPS